MCDDGYELQDSWNSDAAAERAAQALAAEVDALREQHAARSAEWEELSMQLEEQSIA